MTGFMAGWLLGTLFWLILSYLVKPQWEQLADDWKRSYYRVKADLDSWKTAMGASRPEAQQKWVDETLERRAQERAAEKRGVAQTNRSTRQKGEGQ